MGVCFDQEIFWHLYFQVILDSCSRSWKSLKAPFTKGFGLTLPSNSFLSQPNEGLKSVFNYDSYCCYGGRMCFLLKIAGKCFTVFSLGSGSESAEQLRSRSELSSVTAWSQGWSGASSKEMFQHNHGASSSMLCTVTPHGDTPQSPGSFLQELKQHLLPEISIL